MNVSVQTVTPGDAATFLARNTDNRPLREQHVTRLAGAMRRGEWCMNGEPIKVGADGRLLDGQHRLSAIVKSGISQAMVILSGLDPASQDSMDEGIKRKFSDKLKMRGETSAVQLAAAIYSVYAYLTYGHVRTSGLNGAQTPTTAQAFALLDEHPGLRDAVRRMSNTSARPVGLGPGQAAALLYLFEREYPEDGSAFFARLCDGAGLEVGSPILALRNRLTTEATKGHRAVPMWERCAWTIKAFNAWVRGQVLVQVKFSPGGARPEKFPLITPNPDAGV